jgi:hypothetical protein
MNNKSHGFSTEALAAPLPPIPDPSPPLAALAGGGERRRRVKPNA